MPTSLSTIKIPTSLYYDMDTNSFFGSLRVANEPSKIIKVIFHNPATIVYWSDNTKTVVKCNGEVFDKEKGLAMAISKKLLGKEFHKQFRKFIGDDEQ